MWCWEQLADHMGVTLLKDTDAEEIAELFKYDTESNWRMDNVLNKAIYFQQDFRRIAKSVFNPELQTRYLLYKSKEEVDRRADAMLSGEV